MNYWSIICDDFPGLWKKWQQENVVTVGWSPEWLEQHPDSKLPLGGYGWVERNITQMQQGDQIIPFLRENRIGRVATFRRQRIDEWHPLSGEGQGRRVDVVWETNQMPLPDQVALIPSDLRRAATRRTVARLSSDRFLELVTVLQNSENWQEIPNIRDDDEVEEPVDQFRFALETHLEEFIEANFAHINFGRALELYQDEENTGRQFQTAVGNIDLLAKDVDSGAFVVIELKKNRSHDAVVGQVLRYMGWIGAHMAQSDDLVRGIIIVPETTEKLRYALKMLPNVCLFTYAASFALSPVELQRP
jgi:hypothetical protein